MSPHDRTGAELLCDTLESLGAGCVFGVPGTSTVPLFDALRRSRLRTVLAGQELGAAFMANGFARAGRRVGVLCTMPGPGFTCALTGVAEARHDSAALLHVTCTPPAGAGRRFNLQALDQEAMAAPIVKGALTARGAEQIPELVALAWRSAVSGEPGPVLLQIEPEALSRSARVPIPGPPVLDPAAEDERAAEAILRRLRAARRPIMLVGQGCQGGARPLAQLAGRLRVPVCSTLSGRGALPEDHPMSLVFEASDEGLALFNGMLERADLILAIGCKLSHNGSAGFRLRLASDRLIHADAAREVLGANYPASQGWVVDAPMLLERLARLTQEPAVESSAWSPEELVRLREANQAAVEAAVEPRVSGVSPSTPRAFFRGLRAALPGDAILVTDSGLHQVLARRHFPVLSAGGLLAPSDYQSMGFGIPAAIGARLAAPDRMVVALCGDGGMAMTGLELATAVRERIPLTTIVFKDGALGQIRLQQLEEYGHPHAVELPEMNFARLADTVGIPFFRLGAGERDALAEALRAGSSLLEVEIGDSGRMHAVRAVSVARETARAVLPRPVLGWMRRLSRRFRGR